MRVVVCRHAEAIPGALEELRALTEAGVAASEELGRTLARARVATVLTSPLLRARQTAEIAGRRAGARVLVDSRLAPGATHTALLEALAGLDGPVATIGHQPDCSSIVEALTGTAVSFAPGAHAELDLELGHAEPGETRARDTGAAAR
jgi:phosphohistidine phosphatase SixA